MNCLERCDILCINDIKKFMQEYPTTPEEAFIATGTNVFPDTALKSHFQPLDGIRGRLLQRGSSRSYEFVHDPVGPLTIFKYPHPDHDWGQYIIGADPSHVTYGDYAVAQVLNRRTMEQVAVWRARIEPGTFANRLADLGYYYNTALIAPEKEGPGYMTIGKLLGMNYPAIIRISKPDNTPGKLLDTYGWSTNVQSKHMAIGWLIQVVVDPILAGADGKYAGGFVIHDRLTYNEMRDFITLEGGGYGNATKSRNDDTVMSMAIAVTCHNMEPPLTAYVPVSLQAAASNLHLNLLPSASTTSPNSNVSVDESLADSEPIDHFSRLTRTD